MAIPLPPAIELYVKSENSDDAEPLSQCFTPDAIVRDEARAYEGLAAIKEWKTETKRKYRHTVTPLAIAERDGRTILEAELAGEFPGSPVTVNFGFTLKDGRIASLEIG
jgi:SnoaL-like protein